MSQLFAGLLFWIQMLNYSLGVCTGCLIVKIYQIPSTVHVSGLPVQLDLLCAI